MVQFLAVQVRLGRITLDQVPEQYREEVERLLNAQ